jgi:hypothetical protein
MSAIHSIITIISGGIVGYFSASHASSRMIRSVAAAKFRASFAPALARIRLESDVKREGTSEIANFFRAAWIDHAAFIEEFRPFVSEGTAYEKAWENYKSIISEKSIHDGGSGWDTDLFIDENGKANPYRAEVRKMLEYIMEFADQKYSTDLTDTLLRKAKIFIMDKFRCLHA